MAYKKLTQTTTHSQVYRRARKRFLADSVQIRCSYCRYHKWENAKKLSRTWKRHRRNRWKEEKPSIKRLDLLEG